MKTFRKNSPALRYGGWIFLGLVAGLLFARTARLPGAEASAPASLPSTHTGDRGNSAAHESGARLAEEDRQFLLRASQSVIQQERVSRGVLPQLVYPETREYAYLILTDQPATTPELQALVAHKKVSVPEPDPVPFRKWAREDGPIDEHYIKLVIEDNKEVAASFEQATKSSDPEIATYARKTLPVVQNHLKASLALTKVTE